MIGPFATAAAMACFCRLCLSQPAITMKTMAIPTAGIVMLMHVQTTRRLFNALRTSPMMRWTLESLKLLWQRSFPDLLKNSVQGFM
jgi:hypothetical protein